MMTLPRRASREESDFEDRLNSLHPWTNASYIVEVYENQSREGARWGTKYLGKFNLKPYSSKDGKVSAKAFPKNAQPPLGYVWTDTWKPRVDIESDDQGWTYSADVASLVANTNVAESANSMYSVRRRQWVRPMRRRFIDYRWESKDLGISLSSLVDHQVLVSHTWGDGPLGITVFATGRKQLPVVKHRSITDSSVQVGDTLISVNSISLEGKPFSEVIALLQNVSRPAKLTFEKPRTSVLVSAVHSSICKASGVRPGYILTGINGKSLSNIDFEEVVSILELAPSPCVLTFEAPVDNSRTSSLLMKAKNDVEMAQADSKFYRRAQHISVCTTVAAIGSILIA